MKWQTIRKGQPLFPRTGALHPKASHPAPPEHCRMRRYKRATWFKQDRFGVILGGEAPGIAPAVGSVDDSYDSNPPETFRQPKPNGFPNQPVSFLLR